jgi:hypothetical protein
MVLSTEEYPSWSWSPLLFQYCSTFHMYMVGPRKFSYMFGNFLQIWGPQNDDFPGPKLQIWGNVGEILGKHSIFQTIWGNFYNEMGTMLHDPFDLISFEASKFLCFMFSTCFMFYNINPSPYSRFETRNIADLRPILGKKISEHI